MIGKTNKMYAKLLKIISLKNKKTMSGIPHSRLVLEANIYSKIKPVVFIQSDKNTKNLVS
jgi:hypothetical protein